MKDRDILSLYNRREEAAIAETDRRYGRLCRSLARRLLQDDSESEACVSAAYMKLWLHIPPAAPDSLSAYLCRTVRSEAVSMLRTRHRHAPAAANLDELAEALPGGSEGNPEEALSAARVTEVLNRFLTDAPARDRKLFLLRYYFGYALKDTARALAVSDSAAKMILLRMRDALAAALEKEGIVR